MLHEHVDSVLILLVIILAIVECWDVIRHPKDYGMPSWRERFRR